MLGLFLFCRQGYEKDCAAEIQDKANSLAIYGYCESKPNTAFVIFRCHSADDTLRFYQQIHLSKLIYSRQWFIILEQINQLNPQDRLSAIIPCINHLNLDFNKIFWEVPDSEALKPLNRLIKSLASIIDQQSLLAISSAKKTANHLHICFINSLHCYIGYSENGNAHHYPAGIMRLKLPKTAPSRSYLKLDEALHTFLPKHNLFHLFKPGSKAVDLGAAPGGWTWLLSQYNVEVNAIDNGHLINALKNNPRVKHLHMDAFTYKPEQQVDWMVCDIVDKPLRTLALVEKWLINNWSYHYIVILKLPMHKRYAFIKQSILPRLANIQKQYKHKDIFCKHLYYTRDEICLAIIDSNRIFSKLD